MKFTTVLVAASAASSCQAASLGGLDPNWGAVLRDGATDTFQHVLGAASKFLGGVSTFLENDYRAIAKALGDERDEDGMLVRRLIDTGLHKLVSRNEMDKVDMRRRGVKFMDITEHYEFYHELDEHAKSHHPHPVTFPRNVSYPAEVKSLLPLLNKDNMESNLGNLSSFHTRYYKSNTGKDASMWLFEQVKHIAKAQPKIRVFPFHHRWAQRSVIASIPGKHRSGKGKKHEPVVIISAHLDSINLLLPSILPAPGADDNGSGSVTILEVFRVLVESGYQPENTLQFHWYSAEEGGLLGSQDVLTEYKKRKINVKAQLQQDMTGYVLDPTTEKFGVITDYVDRGLTDFVELCIDSYTSLPYAEDVCGYACSDHASGTKVGFPSAFVIESLMKDINPYIHSVRDTIDHLSFDHMLQHAYLTLGFAYELGKYTFKH